MTQKHSCYSFSFLECSLKAGYKAILPRSLREFPLSSLPGLIYCKMKLIYFRDSTLPSYELVLVCKSVVPRSSFRQRSGLILKLITFMKGLPLKVAALLILGSSVD
ncbi:hypothetical protein TNIN_295161 [Trichonephila inaurata madagascariensis]|uniref:Uncharacterized protein n=1 Tax=Trichonephila inaurata madagascariensis TaxID=2747483 RepID=A0A8X7BXS2_9ARAC|nr:hypothetical protein TNIN_295161 [Trichonephila inaurata madagascariensis]